MLAIFGDQLYKRYNGAKWTGQMVKGGRKCGTGVRNGSKGVGTQGTRYARLMMKENEGEEAIHAYSIITHVLYNGMESL